jgi:hypothetical protein
LRVFRLNDLGFGQQKETVDRLVEPDGLFEHSTDGIAIGSL